MTLRDLLLTTNFSQNIKLKAAYSEAIVSESLPLDLLNDAGLNGRMLDDLIKLFVDKDSGSLVVVL